jgi:hypothetical protein
LSNARVLLRYALLSITESIRNDSERYRSIFYNMSPLIIDYSGSSSQGYTSSSMYGPDQQQKSSPNYNTEANISMIVEEAEKLFNKVVKDCINTITTECAFSKSSSLSLPLLPPSNEEQQKSHEIKPDSS